MNHLLRALALVLTVGCAGPSRPTTEPVTAHPSDAGASSRPTRVVPTTKDGRPVGFKIYAIAPGSIYERAGFAPGDLMVEIDGKLATAPDELDVAARNASNGQVISISIERQAKPLTLKLTIE